MWDIKTGRRVIYERMWKYFIDIRCLFDISLYQWNTDMNVPSVFFDSSISDFTSVLSQETDSKMTRTFVIQEATSRACIGLVSERWGRWGVIWARVNHEREILLTLSRLSRKKCISASRGTMITDSASD